MTEINLRRLGFFMLMLFYAIIITYQIDLPAADDMPRHLKNGEQILQGHWEVLYKNVYSYTLPDQPFVNHHWLSGVLYYLLYKLTGWVGLALLKVITLLAAFILLFKTALRRANFWLVAVFAIPAIIMFYSRSMLRPENFSMLFTCFFLYALTRYLQFATYDLPDKKRGSSPGNHKSKIINFNSIYWLILIQLLWVNLHIFFIVGPLLVAGLLVEQLIKLFTLEKGSEAADQKSKIKTLALLLAGLIAVCFINPSGWHGIIYPFEQIFNDTGFGVNENRPVFSFLREEPWGVNLPIVFYVICVGLLAASFFVSSKKPLRIFYFIACASTAVTGFMAVRLNIFFSILFLPAITNNLNDLFLYVAGVIRKRLETISPILYNYLKKVIAVSFSLLVCVLIVVHLSGKLLPNDHAGLGVTHHSNHAAEFIRQHNLKGPIFNDFDIGSYLIWNFYPQEKVFTDNRPEAYSSHFFKQQFMPLFRAEGDWYKALGQYNFNMIILYTYNNIPDVRNFMYRRIADSSWAFIYADEYALMLIRNVPANKEIIDKYRITRVNVVDRLFYLLDSGEPAEVIAAADLIDLAGYSEKAMETYFKIVQQWPERAQVWLAMAQAELRNENVKSPLVAVLLLKEAIRNGFNTAEAYTLLGEAYRRLGLNREGADALHTALRINPERADAKRILKEMGQPD